MTELAAKRVEGDVVLQFKVPTANTDNSSPADLDRIEVYAHTGALPAAADFLKYGTLVQSIEVKRLETGAAGAPGAAGLAGEAQSAKVGADAPATASAEPLVEQGWATSVRETLTEKHMELGPTPPTRAAALPVEATPIETLETPGTVNFTLPVLRYYTVVGVSRSRNRRGPYAGPIRVPLVPPLHAPGKVETNYTADAISLSWPGQPEDIVPFATGDAAAAATAGGAAIDNLNQETPGTREIYADIETPGTADAPWPVAAPTSSRPVPPPAPRFGYNVYETASASVSEGASAPSAPNAPIAPLNAALLTAPAFDDPRVEFGTERCYVVRRVEMAGTIAIESAPSPLTCVTPVDKFAPAPPKALVAVANSSALSLIWEANNEADLGGYLVLRGEVPGDKLAPLTKAPISDAAYVDTSIRSNRTYVYEVVAVDKAGNQSAPSNRIEETIR